MTQDPTTSRPLPGALSSLCLVLFALLVSCGTYEDKRIRELLHEKGFGTRASGDATRENYVSGLDRVQILVAPDALLRPGAERLAELQVPQPVAIDGTIFVPFVGPVYVLGLTEPEVAALVRSQLRTVLQDDVQLQARITSASKFFYAVGETRQKGRVLMSPDMTLIDAVVDAGWSPFANLGRVSLIRPDAEHPLVIEVNVREMLMTGYTRPNFQIRERDILYVPPTFLGTIGRLFERLLQPVALAVRTMLGAAQITYAYDVLNGSVAFNTRGYRF